MAFRNQFIEIEGVDPFPLSLTIASACNHIFRHNYLKEKTIGIIPNGKFVLTNLNQTHLLMFLVCFRWLPEQDTL